MCGRPRCWQKFRVFHYDLKWLLRRRSVKLQIDGINLLPYQPQNKKEVSKMELGVRQGLGMKQLQILHLCHPLPHLQRPSRTCG